MSATVDRHPSVVRTRDALISAAVALLGERDAADITITQVVEVAGVSRPTFYQRFPDLGALFAAVGLSRLHDMFVATEVHDHGTSLEKRLEHVFGAIVDRMTADAVFYIRVHRSAGGAAFHLGAVEATAEWLRSQEALRGRAAADAAVWDFLAGGVVWIAIQRIAAAVQDTSAAPPHSALDLARMVATTLEPVAAQR